MCVCVCVCVCITYSGTYNFILWETTKFIDVRKESLTYKRLETPGLVNCVLESPTSLHLV